MKRDEEATRHAARLGHERECPCKSPDHWHTWIGDAEAYVEDYNSTMHPLVEDVATLDTLPAECVVLDADDQVWRNHVDPEGVCYWTCTGDDAGWSASDVILPARVLHWPTD